MLRKMKALATTNTSLTPPPQKKHNVEVQLDNLWLNNFDQGGAKDGGHSSTKIISEIGVLYVRKCKILNTLSKIVG